jgi:hypothetical protein
MFNVRAISKKNGMRKTTKSSLHRYIIFLSNVKRMLTILASFFYIIDGGMILHRLKRRTAKIKIDFFTIGSRNQLLLMFFAKTDKNLIVLSRQLLIPLNSSKDDNSFVIIFLFLKFEIFVVSTPYREKKAESDADLSSYKRILMC